MNRRLILILLGLSQKHYEALSLTFDIQDPSYFHSIYTRDPDGHMVELTTLAVEEAGFDGGNGGIFSWRLAAQMSSIAIFCYGHPIYFLESTS